MTIKQFRRAINKRHRMVSVEGLGVTVQISSCEAERLFRLAGGAVGVHSTLSARTGALTRTSSF